MQLEDYFDFFAPDDIRIKGHRIGIETVLYEYIHRGRTAEDIASEFPTLSREEVYATILYYLHNERQIGAYLAEWLADCEASERKARENPAPVQVRLAALKSQIDRSGQSVSQYFTPQLVEAAI